LEINNLTAYITSIDANSTNNNTNIGFLAGATGTSTGEIGEVIFDVSGTGDIWRAYSGGSVSNGTYTVGTLEAHIDHSGNATFATSVTCPSCFGSAFNGNTRGTNTVFASDSDDGGSGSITGVAQFRNADETTASGTETAGSVLIRPGGSFSTSGVHGIIWYAEEFSKGATVTQYNLQCISSTMTVADCGASPTTVIGVAATTTTPVQVVTSGEMFVNASAAVTVGHTVCAGATAGKVTDSGGLAACTLGTEVGIVIDISQVYNGPSGATITATSTLPLVHMKVD
jgi:hypothetical protein